MTDLIFSGVHAAAEWAESAAADVLRLLGTDTPLKYSDTACSCPAVHALTGMELRRAGDLPDCLALLRVLPGEPGAADAAQKAGIAALLYAELSDLLRASLRGESGAPVPDAVIRSLGVPLIAGDVPGIAVIMGSAKCAAHVCILAHNYLRKGLTVFLAGPAAEAAEGLKAEAGESLLRLGGGDGAPVRALSAIIRMAQIFCAPAPGDEGALSHCLRERLPTFVNLLDEPDVLSAAVLQGAEVLGIPVLRLGDEGPEALAEASLERCGIRLKPGPLVLPVNYDSAYEGERVRDPDCGVEFSPACELVRMTELSAAEDHGFLLTGPELPAAGEEPLRLPLAVSVEVSGAKMKAEFESVIENRLHRFLCWAEGVEHRGQRNLLRIRLSRESLDKGLGLSDLAEMIYTGIRREFEPVVERCRVTLITEAEAAERFADTIARPRYRERDARLAALTDESVDCFYSCTTCQSIAPRHCCVVTPERGGMCGALSWPDAAAAWELSPTGPNRPIPKGEAEDDRLGIFAAVNRAVAAATGGAVSRLSLYSLVEHPMTGCGRLECICGVEPLSGGVIVVNRDYSGMTPAGMGFEELASMVFPGEQNPGFMGISRRYISSRKFLSAEGGALRIVWMPRELKEDVSAALDQRVGALYGIEHFSDMICDETIAEDPEALLAFLQAKGHPVLGMEPIM